MSSDHIFSRVVSFIRRKTSQRYRFNQQFAQGKWESMKEVADLGRYSIIVGYTKHFCRKPHILDLGCGEGILLDKFCTADFSSYLGVDFSEVAVAAAQKKVTADVVFKVGNLNTLKVDGQYDVIIYNESLYYLSNPRAAVSALFSHIAPGGIFIISMVDKHGEERIGLWNTLAEILKPVEKTKIANAAGDSWTIQVYHLKDSHAH